MTAEQKMTRAVWSFIIGVGVVLMVFAAVLYFGVRMALAHEHHSAAGRFYESWTMPDNRSVSCCNHLDCAPAQSRLRNGRWQSRFTDADEWTDVPEPKIERERDSPDGQSHLCARKALGGVTVFCFLPAAGG